MIQRISRRKFDIYAFDLESHNDIESIEKRETSMWLSCFINENSKMEDESSYLYNMDDVLNKLDSLSSQKRTRTHRPITNIAVYIWNLSFEYSFILPYLLKRGFTYKENIGKGDEFVFNSVCTKTCSSVWQVQLKFHKNSGIVLLRDLAKVFSGSLRKVAKSFNLPTQKGEIDYRLNRLHGHVVTKEEKEYCFKDTRIIIDILLSMAEKDDRFFWNAVSAASYSMKKMLKTGWPRTTKPYKAFREMYPEIDENSEEGLFLRKTVSGGITYAQKHYQFKVMKCDIGHIDLHQSHPSSAFYNLYPSGKGKYFTGKPRLGKICACHIRISYDDVRLHSIISLIGIDMITDREIWCWDFEIPTMMKCYVNLHIEYIDGWAYTMRPLKWRKYYENNYNNRKHAKAVHDDFNIMYFKLLNNSSYGKLLERLHEETFVNTIRPDGSIDSDIIPKDKTSLPPCSHYTYLPAGSCIPARTRVTLIEGALKLGWENVLYFDTDSIFFIWNEHTKYIWEHEFDQEDHLGGWGWEEMSQKAQFTAPKRYKIESEGHATIKAGGINFDKFKADNNIDELLFDEVDIVSSKWDVQRAYRVRGGTIIEFQEKEMSIQDKYIEIAKRNLYDDIG